MHEHDIARIADALRANPAFKDPHTSAGADRVRFTTPLGNDFDLTLQDAAEDAQPPAPPRQAASSAPLTKALFAAPLTDDLAATLLAHPDFVAAIPDHPREDTLTVQMRSGRLYHLILDIVSAAEAEDGAHPADDVASAAHRMLLNDPGTVERAAAQLLSRIAATWDAQDLELRQHARALARALLR